MPQKYRIYVLGPIPPDLKERLATIHAEGILKGRREDVTAPTRTANGHNSPERHAYSAGKSS